MTNLDDADALRKGRESVQLLHALLTQTPTPGHRVFATAGLIASIYTTLVDALNGGVRQSEQVSVIVNYLDKLKPLFEDPTANFVDMLATLHSELETAKLVEGFDDRHKSIAVEMQQYLHSMAFSPPLGVQDDPGQIASDLAELAAFVKEFKAETDRGAALVGAALVDNRLERLLRSHFREGAAADKLLSNAAPLGTFSAHIDACSALGLITEVEYRECALIRRIRNDFAHRLHGLTFETGAIANRCRELKAMPYEQWGSPRQRFTNSVITLCLVLWHRPAHAMNLKAQEREWPWHLAFGTMKASR